MKRILSLLLVLLSFVTYSQVTDNSLTTQNNNNIFTMGFNPTRHGNMFENIINSKVNKRTPEFMDSLDITKIIRFYLNGSHPTATQYNVTWPNKSGTVAFLDDISGGVSGITKYIQVSGASTSDIDISDASTLSGVMDGDGLIDGNAYLIKDQSDYSENGVYTYPESGIGAWVRVDGLNTSEDFLYGLRVKVIGGSDNSLKEFQFVSAPAVNFIIDDSDIVFTEILPNISSSNGITQTGTNFKLGGTISENTNFNGEDYTINFGSGTGSNRIGSFNVRSKNAFSSRYVDGFAQLRSGFAFGGYDEFTADGNTYDFLIYNADGSPVLGNNTGSGVGLNALVPFSPNHGISWDYTADLNDLLYINGGSFIMMESAVGPGTGFFTTTPRRTISLDIDDIPSSFSSGSGQVIQLSRGEGMEGTQFGYQIIGTSYGDYHIEGLWRVFDSENDYEVFRFSTETNVVTADTIALSGFRLGTSSTPGYVLTSDAEGKGTWAAPSSGIGGSVGATDNAILRADVGSGVVQSSPASIDDSGNIALGLSSTAGTSRTISAQGSETSINTIVESKGLGRVVIGVGNDTEPNIIQLGKTSVSPDETYIVPGNWNQPVSIMPDTSTTIVYANGNWVFKKDLSTGVSPTLVVEFSNNTRQLAIDGRLLNIQETGTSFTLDNSYIGNNARCTAATTISVTVPEDLLLESVIVLTQWGDGNINLIEGTDVDITGKTSTTFKGDMIWLYLIEKSGGISYYIGR